MRVTLKEIENIDPFNCTLVIQKIGSVNLLKGEE